MDLELVTIGDELLLGFTIDTNAAHLARELAAIGVRISRRSTVGDDPAIIAEAVREALHRTGAVITTGGLGPTADDRTKPAIGELFGRTMVMDEEILTALEQRWLKRFGVALPASNRQQAMVPSDCTILSNRHGSAPGIWLEDNTGRWVAMLPGVPREMRGMLADTLLPRLRDRMSQGGAVAETVVRSRTLRTANIAESALADRLGELAGGVNGLSLAFLPGRDGVDLRVTVSGVPAKEAERQLADAARLIDEKVSHFIYGSEDDDMAAIVLALCGERGATVSVAESCSGGLLGGRFTSIPGSSAIFMGGVIAYHNDSKIRDLDVRPDVLAEFGAVSEETARAMASGVRKRFGTTVGLSITGVAGPGGGTPEKPVGTVWVAIDIEGVVQAVRATMPGDRNEMRYRSTQLVLDRLRRAFNALPASAGWTADD
ncbi:MAG: competence/damage-inducible protein A [Phycisphaerae bacterium]|nr:competence/damage-inducible protein A [Gemmatimonadaceae bacterium]